MGGLAAPAGACHLGPNLPTPIRRELACQANKDGVAGRKWRLSPYMLLPAGAALGALCRQMHKSPGLLPTGESRKSGVGLHCASRAFFPGLRLPEQGESQVGISLRPEMLLGGSAHAYSKKLRTLSW